MRQLLYSFVLGAAFAALPAVPFAQSATPETSLRGLIVQYQTASDLVRPTIARDIERVSRRIPKTAETASLRAQALTALSRQAAFDQRKDLALKTAREAVILSANLVGPEAKAVRAKAAIAATHALILKQEYLDAMSTMVAARRAYGPIMADSDPVWDGLLLWETIAQSSAPARLEAQIGALSLTDEEESALLGPKGLLCGADDASVSRNRGSGREPVYPVISWFSDLQGGVVMRSQIDLEGKVVSTRATAFAPTEGFAAAAENAVPTWSYRVLMSTPAICRENVLTVLAFELK